MALSLVTCIDALVVGVSFGVHRTAVLVPALIIGTTGNIILFA